ncbi:hypothetical protein A2291_01480 [candidate division WOR-1 bacterium RIFOXYB2_FULL_42_35]|uniref:Uncharacterized protein n=1 Tax=candidate division WOR-1 bacterium RIFOXYC2_FULL_41_25 TaxID=1802586 RepID=A0A1F4TQP6_UNCSA|nr:MAG: hypothetical protein A2247_00800 [candidate division WOR-1 bacterium RIFOXYA2_FULL_41_14]OGC21516.1 MAG: hypothetical protein A2291_01480 [candidate division WOR-1 bacterium RIFOXYB2_FULL_42_35]OGC35021.1 MAG: hypothetical protein A2462_05450 [candidate division WOR-1 bacterium RIFOXYC2_FULL_41_25]OGC42066.1 MAG: hypothetical protein A2548_06710 [candidate division WOR-1 bacterium RIFOXYD2_FULL_41_8]
MIEIFTVDNPDKKLKSLTKDIFDLPKGNYDLPTHDHSQQKILDQLYQLGVRQIIHDGSKQEIHCLNGFKFAQNPSGQHDKLILKN